MNQTCFNCFSGTNGTNPCPVCGYDNSVAGDQVNGLPPGTILHDGFFVGRVLGQGGFGITYLGYELHSKRRIAIKEYFPNGVVVRNRLIVQPTNAENNAFFCRGLELFNKEAQILSRLSGLPNIVEVISFFFENNTGYFVMEFLEGESLKDYLAIRGGRLPFQEALTLLLPTMEALETIHHEGMLHRDIAPDNIYITADGVPKLIDFGAARFRSENETKSIRTIVKPGYAPMEQYTSQSAQGPWSDVYAMGATFYRTITGITPPDAPMRAMNDELLSPMQLGCQLPMNADYAIMRALSPRITFRFSSMAEFIAALTKPDSAGPIASPDGDFSSGSGLPDGFSIFGSMARRYHVSTSSFTSSDIPVTEQIGPGRRPATEQDILLKDDRVPETQTRLRAHDDRNGTERKNGREDLVYWIILAICVAVLLLIIYEVLRDHSSDWIIGRIPENLSRAQALLTQC